MSRAVRAILAAELAGDKAPEWVEVFPAGPVIEARDGRKFRADPAAVLAAFAANNGPLPIDYEHGQAHRAPEGLEAPAAGWITRLEDRAGAIWGLVEWTARAAKMIVEREYRFLSPEFVTDKAGKIRRLVGAGLVNRPAFEMTALSREQHHTEEKTMKAIAKALGLEEDAAETAILASIGAAATNRTALCQALKVDAGSDQAAVLAAVEKLRSDLEAARADPDKSELASVKTDLETTRTELAALRKAQRDKEVDQLLDDALKAKKIVPAQRDDYVKLCATDDGLERVKAVLASAAPGLGPSGLGAHVADDAEPDPVELAAKARHFQDEQARLGRAVSMSEAVAHVKELK